MIDAARVRTPTDKPRVERMVHYVQHNFFAGEAFIDLEHCRARARDWCSTTAGMRTHGTTQLGPLEHFRTEELLLLAPAPTSRFDTPVFSQPKVHRDCHVEVDKALYSVPRHLVGCQLSARRDSTTIRLSFKGELVKVHTRVPAGRRSTDAAAAMTYATRDTASLLAAARTHGGAVGRYAAAILDTPFRWTKMRQVYRLLGSRRNTGPVVSTTRAPERSRPRPST